MTNQQKLSHLDAAMVRSLKQCFVAHDVIPGKFSFTLPNVGEFEVECIYPEGQYGQINIRVI
jgi:hypothetical protein